MKLRNLFSPTPKKMFRLGMALMTTFSTASIPAAAMDHKWIAIICTSLGLLGVFLTNLYKEEDK